MAARRSSRCRCCAQTSGAASPRPASRGSDFVYDFDLLAIGSGPAGQRAAVQAAKLGKRAAIVEKLRCVGGVCVDTGTIPSKTLREAVITFAGTGGRFGRRRDEPRPTAPELLGHVGEVVQREVDVIE